MTDAEYTQLADAFFKHLDQALEEADIDYELAPGGILEMEFDDGSKIIINRQPPMHEIWVAAKSGGFHFRWQDGAWRDTRGGDELFAALERMVSQQAGEKVRLA